jgi:hypothetical protein
MDAMIARVAAFGAVVIAVAALSNCNDTAIKPVDFSFSLRCRQLEGPTGKGKMLLMTVEQWEKGYAEAERTGHYNDFYKRTEGIIYTDDVPFAYVHGEPDGGAIGWLAGTFIYEVTPEAIFIESQPTPIGPMMQGLVDRRTGHAELSEYHFDVPPNNKGWEGTTRYQWKQFAWEYEPSKPAKF